VLPQSPSLPETFPTLNFDDETSQHSPAEMLPDNAISEAAALPTPDETNMLQESRLTLEAPEIDFSQHIKEAADIQENTISVTNEKQQKRIAKDSNLIDWALTDET